MYWNCLSLVGLINMMSLVAIILSLGPFERKSIPWRFGDNYTMFYITDLYQESSFLVRTELVSSCSMISLGSADK